MQERPLEEFKGRLTIGRQAGTVRCFDTDHVAGDSLGWTTVGMDLNVRVTLSLRVNAHPGRTHESEARPERLRLGGGFPELFTRAFDDEGRTLKGKEAHGSIGSSAGSNACR